jgi:hypothetical protein
MDSYSTPSVLELKFLAKLEISELKEVIKKSTDKMKKLIAEDRLEKIESFVVKKRMDKLLPFSKRRISIWGSNSN